jgi:hypothetical protein
VAENAELVSSDATSEIWQTGRGSVAIRWKREVLTARITGHGDRLLIPHIVARMETVVRQAERIRALYDVWDMASYDSELRTELTRWFLEHRSHLDAIEVVARSKIVLMGISVANLALGGIVRTYDSHESFQVELRRRGIEG